MGAAKILSEPTYDVHGLWYAPELDVHDGAPEIILNDFVVGSTALVESGDCGEYGSTVGGEKLLKVVDTIEYTERKASVWEKVIQAWEGRVILNSPGDSEFTAIISDRTCRSNPDEEVVIGYEHVLESDRYLISEGAIFYWNIGRYRRYLDSGKLGPSKNKYEIRFRRLPGISSRQTKEILQIAKRISAKLHGD